jgi:hypothetical protein
MKKVIYFFAVTMITILIMSNSGCDEQSNSNTELAAKQEQLMQEANRQVGMPAIKNFQERKLLKMILELRDQENLICYAYIVPEMTGKPIFLGKCIGYGIPYATEYTNPQITERHTGEAGGGNIVIPQADPNGLFMPSNAEGTWLMMIDPNDNQPHPVYIEPRVLVSPFKFQ